MRPKISVGLILLMVFSREGTCSKLNLTGEVERYIREYIGYGVEDYSLKGKKVGTQSPAITASTGELAYGDGCTKPSRDPNMQCSDAYMFYIYNGISTPFSLLVNITLSFRGIRNDTHLVDINNASYVYWNPDNITIYPNDTTNYSEEKCEFYIQVLFNGTFAYKVPEVKGDKPKEGSYGIGSVAQINRNLTQYGDNVLAYNVSGTFLHAVACEPSAIERTDSETILTRNTYT